MVTFLELTFLEFLQGAMTAIVQEKPLDPLGFLLEKLVKATTVTGADEPRGPLPVDDLLEEHLVAQDATMKFDGFTGLLCSLAQSVCAIFLQALTCAADTVRTSAAKDKAEKTKRALGTPTLDEHASEDQHAAAFSNQLTQRLDLLSLWPRPGL